MLPIGPTTGLWFTAPLALGGQTTTTLQTLRELGRMTR